MEDQEQQQHSSGHCMGKQEMHQELCAFNVTKGILVLWI
jgi:hypothetical protein